MSIIDDEHKVDRVLESTNLNEYELINLPIEQPGDSLHELSIRASEWLPLWIQEVRRGWHLVKGVHRTVFGS